MSHTDRPQHERLLDYDLPPLPVPTDILVYTEKELEGIVARGDLFSRDMQGVVWL